MRLFTLMSKYNCRRDEDVSMNSRVPWGLDRLDQDGAQGDGRYNFPASAGGYMQVYITCNLDDF